MRLLLACIAGCFALAVAAMASADPVRMEVARPSETPEAGEPWAANVIIAKYGRPARERSAVIRIRSGDATLTVRAARTTRAGVYRVRVVFPYPGRWNFEAPFGRRVARTTVTVKPVSLR